MKTAVTKKTDCIAPAERAQTWKAESASDFAGDWKQTKPHTNGKVTITIGTSIACANFITGSKFDNGKTFTEFEFVDPGTGETGYLEFTYKDYYGAGTTDVDYRIEPAGVVGGKKWIECHDPENTPETWEAEEGG